ncbi:ABC transporter substrate-binding protein [Paenibacillus caseinilyticus]|uniref:ABC transporter substrate-binding protein n=1 Tax=Paenibacillus mucilaginosus K02 TaxID=997761 RepID=I0BD82_9BACL|nr:extracellular solute-binding protein [Paenibacillus mucilaginosus]AFH60329.1 ABC transporter substrate-binding protein [Paenibacillus mucilaginosus K02]
MKKQKCLAVLSVLSAAVMAAACSGEPKPADSRTAPGTEGTPAPKSDITVSVYDRGNVPAAEGKIESNRWTKWLNENGPANVTFVPIPRTDPAQKWNVLFASQSAPDIIHEFDPNILNPLIDQKQLMPLDELIEKHSVEYKQLLKDYPGLKKVTTGRDGKIYKIGRVLESSPLNALFIRTDWLKALNLEVPKTTEELYQVAKAFAERDPDGNGKKDTYGIALSWRSENVIDGMFGSPGSSYGLVNGQPSRAFEYTRESVAFKKRLFDEGLVDKDFANDKNGAKAKQEFLNGRIGIYPTYVGSWFEFTVADLTTLRKSAPNAAVEPIALPKSNAGEYIPEIQNPVQATTAINARTKDGAAAIRYIDFLDRKSTGRTLLFGLEGMHHSLDANGCPKSIDPEKTKQEVSWAADFAQSYSRLLDGRCSLIANQFDQTKPEQKAGLEIYEKAKKLYMDPTKQYRTVTLGEHMPTLPKDLQTTLNTVTKDINDIWLKSVLGGQKYSVDQAYKDVVSTWEKAGGKQIDEFMIDWYTKKKDASFLMKDLWETVSKQAELK